MRKSVLLLATVTAAAATGFYGSYVPPGGPPYFEQGTLPPTESAYAPFYKGTVSREKQREEGRPHDYDVRKYVLKLTINDEAQTISGTTTIETTITADGTDEVVLDLADELTVSAVRVNGAAAGFDHSGGLLTVELSPPLDTGEAADVAVDYGGHPTAGLYFEDGVIYSFTEPDDSDHWFPCYDHPSDKADEGCALTITVPEGYLVASVGRLIGVFSDMGGNVSFYWVGEYPIAMYLISIAARDYATFSQTWEGMPIDYFVYPQYLEEAEAAYANTPQMFDCFKELYGEYPFKAEKYGMAMAPFGGAMEHQTCTTIGEWFLDPAPGSDWIIAHELSHQWWGDCVTCGTWADIWLNEGFATYSDALFTEYSQGFTEFYYKMQSFKYYYFEEDEELRFPIYDPEYMWGATVYEKGAWVLHMLRHLLGDEEFFAALRHYRSQHSYGTAVTAELITDLENYTGEELDWFFDEWVYLAGYPEFEYDWTVYETDPTKVHVTVRQVQELDPLTPVFQTYVDLSADVGETHETVTVWVGDELEEYDLDFEGEVEDLLFDKDGWLLCKVADTTPITLEYLEADGITAGIAVEWATRDEYEAVGFNLYRRPAGGKGPGVKVNNALVAGRSPYRFEDKGLEPGTSYSYTLEAVTFNGTTEAFGPVTACAGPGVPLEFALAQNFPNPAAGRTVFRFSIPEAADAQLDIFDITGRKVATVLDSPLAAGEYEIEYEPELAPGVYVYRLRTDTDAALRKMVVVR